MTACRKCVHYDKEKSTKCAYTDFDKKNTIYKNKDCPLFKENIESKKGKTVNTLELLKKRLVYINKDIYLIDWALENMENSIFYKEERANKVKRLEELEEEKDNILARIALIKKKTGVLK